MRYVWNIIVFLTLLFLVGCYSQRQGGLLQTRKGLPTYTPDTPMTYQVHSGDVLQCHLYGLDYVPFSSELSLLVDEHGMVTIPFLPASVPIKGLTLVAAHDTLLHYLHAVSPHLDDLLVDLAQPMFGVLGDAGCGKYLMSSDRMNIYQALALTGNLFDTADKTHIRIIRDIGEPTPLVLDFDIRPVSVVDSKYFYVYPNDLIYVSRDPHAFYKVPSYAGFIALVSSSVAMLATVLTYLTPLF